MNKIRFAIISVIISFAAYSQNSITLQLGQSYSNFRFEDSYGNHDNSFNNKMNYCFGLSYNISTNKGIYFRPELGYKSYGAMSSLDNSKLDWSLDYFDFNVGAGYKVSDWKIQPLIGISMYYSYLMKANQVIGNYYYDLIDNNSIKKSDYGINIHGGLSYDITDIISLQFEFRNAFGLNQIETDQNQKLYNKAISFHFGLLFYLTNTTE